MSGVSRALHIKHLTRIASIGALDLDGGGVSERLLRVISRHIM